MDDFERNYGTGRRVLGVVAALGWVVAFLGVATSLYGAVGLVSADDLASRMGPLGAVSAGACALLLGLVGVGATQHMRATFDVSDMTREMLILARRGSAPRLETKGDDRSDETHAVRPVLRARESGQMAAAARPKVAGPVTTTGKIHPIFSARPPG